MFHGKDALHFSVGFSREMLIDEQRSFCLSFTGKREEGG